VECNGVKPCGSGFWRAASSATATFSFEQLGIISERKRREREEKEKSSYMWGVFGKALEVGLLQCSK
jgi:hypothetical protein